MNLIPASRILSFYNVTLVRHISFIFHYRNPLILCHSRMWLAGNEISTVVYVGSLVLRPFAFISFSSSQNDEFKAQW